MIRSHRWESGRGSRAWLAAVAATLALAAGGARAQTWSPASWDVSAAGEAAEPPTAEREASWLRLADAGGYGGNAFAARQPAPIPPRSVPLIRRMRPNTISLGVQGQYGGIRGSSRLADGFDHGPGYAFRFRYMLSPGAALGFSFEHQRYGSIQPPLNTGDFADSHLVVTTISVEAVLYRHRAQQAHPYFVLGAGYASPDIVFAEEVASRVNEGAFLVGGIGFERFVRERFSVDGCLRVYGQIANSDFSSMGQVSLGIHLYPGD